MGSSKVYTPPPPSLAFETATYSPYVPSGNARYTPMFLTDQNGMPLPPSPKDMSRQRRQGGIGGMQTNTSPFISGGQISYDNYGLPVTSNNTSNMYSAVNGASAFARNAPVFRGGF